MDPVQLIILRIGLYELVELGLTPHAITEHVDLAKALVYPQAAGFTNGQFMRLQNPRRFHFEFVPGMGQQHCFPLRLLDWCA